MVKVCAGSLASTPSRSSPANWWLPLASLDVDYERLIPLSSRDISKVAVDFSLLYRLVQGRLTRIIPQIHLMLSRPPERLSPEWRSASCPSPIVVGPLTSLLYLDESFSICSTFAVKPRFSYSHRALALQSARVRTPLSSTNWAVVSPRVRWSSREAVEVGEASWLHTCRSD